MKRIDHKKYCFPFLLKFIFCVFFLLNCQAILSQDVTLSLSIKDLSGKSLTNPTISINQLPSGRLLYRSTDSSRQFKINRNSKISLQVSVISMRTFDTIIQVTVSDIFLNVKMEPVTSSMSGITVVSVKKPLMKEEDDKTVVDAEVLAASSTNAFEVIEKTPGAVIDQDGNIYLTSTTPATVFINGREMKLSGADLSSLLKSLPAGSISKIEILRNPSARFDASGSGGIINIVLKKGVKLGNSGSMNLTYFQGVYGTATGGFSFNRSGDKTNAYISYQYTKKNSFEEIFSDRTFLSDSTLIRQHSYTTYPSFTHYINAGADHSFFGKCNLSYDGRMTFTDNLSKASNAVDIMKAYLGNQLGETAADISNANTSFYLSNTFTLKKKIDTAGSEWTSVFEYDRFAYNNSQDYVNSFLQPARHKISGDGINDNHKDMFIVQSDLTLKLPLKYTLEAGFKWNRSRSSNLSDYHIDTGNAIRIADVFQTNTYDYREDIGAVYLQLAKSFHGFIIKPGLRFEVTDISGHQIVPRDTGFGIKRNDLFPYLYIKHPLFRMYGKTLMGSAIFRKSIRRPYYESLNPYPKYVDQYLYESGNPALKPQFTTSYELNATFNDIPVFAIGINDTRDIFSSVIYQDPSTKIAFRTFDNLGKNREYYFRLVTGIPPGGKYFFYLGGVFNRNEYRGFYQNQPFNYNRSGYTLFTFHEYKFTKKFSMNMQGFLRSKALQNFYELNTFGGMFVSASKSLLRKKLTINISVSDVLRTNRVSFNFDRNDQLIEGRRINDTRRLGIAIRYNFGIKPKEEKKTNFEAPQEAKE